MRRWRFIFGLFGFDGYEFGGLNMDIFLIIGWLAENNFGSLIEMKDLWFGVSVDGGIRFMVWIVKGMYFIKFVMVHDYK